MAELTYQQNGDYLIPNLTMEETQTEESLGKYGILRQTYLQEHRKGTYTSMLMTGRLWPHLLDIDRTAQAQVDSTLKLLMEQSGVTENLKADNQMEWVQQVNSLKLMAEEAVLNELIYN